MPDLVPFGNNYNDPDRPIVREGCKLCLSSHRVAAEEEYAKTGRYARAYDLLKKKGEKISYNATRNHLLFHYLAPINNSLAREYAEDVEKWLSMQGDSRSALRRTMAMLEREIFMLASQAEELHIDDRRKVDDTINKLASTLLSYRAKIEELDRSQEPVTIIFNQLQLIIEEEIKQLNDPQSKRAMVNVIERLTDSCGDMLVEVMEHE